MRGVLVILLTVAGVACGRAATPTSPTGDRSDQRLLQQRLCATQLPARRAVEERCGPRGGVRSWLRPGGENSCRFLADGFFTRLRDVVFRQAWCRAIDGSTFTQVFPGNSIAVFEELSSDIAAGVEFLRSRPEIDRNRIGLAGASQAGWIVPLPRRRATRVHAVDRRSHGLYGIEIFYSNIVEVTNAPVEEGYKQLPSFNGVHGFDPKPILASISVPGLWLLGGEDRSIPTPATVAILDQLIASGKPYTHVVFPGFGHNLAPSWPAVDQWLARSVSNRGAKVRRVLSRSCRGRGCRLWRIGDADGAEL